ncbi:ABC transporter permease [Lichenifustis flavocetrariae]|uniref:ABC transporter permease n=1 Tax=Lichenifustis flavocetrariae TaxID=2949735 RepID=A0AA42CIZ0_9HYPH|nr:ABC transporter permease [Lichenifustis flavocetrariae]MCW6507411.1 ABC transporter permease [Lichenifustis flavocetrariae]
MLTGLASDTALILASSLRLAVPLIFACIAGLWSERSGVVDIGLEGKMLVAAFASAVVAYQVDSAWAGLAAGILASVALGLVHGFAVIDQRGNQIVSGAAINLVAAGLTALLGNAWYGEGGRTPQLDSVASRFHEIPWPGEASLGAIPVLGPFYSNLLAGHVVLTYLAILLVPLTSFVLYRTRFGLRLRATGENPAAVDTAGISVRGLRYAGVVICGVLCGFAGTYLSVAQAASFLPSMTAGKGFIALAALVFSKWRPWPALFTCLLFGFLDAISIRLQGAVIPGVGEVPVQAIQALPYLLTVILLAGFVGRAIPPKASGIPYVKER